MSITIEVLSGFNERFREDFKSFFSGVYEKDIMARIIGDLSQFISNDYSKRILFGFLTEDDSVDIKVVYEIKRNVSESVNLRKEDHIETFDFSDNKRQRILILELSPKYTQLDRDSLLDFQRNNLKSGYDKLSGK